MKHLNLLTALMIFAILFLGGCATVPDNIPETLSPIEYFQKAQEASGKQNYKAALLYYQTFMERYPQDAQRKAEAEFEIAFLYYKEKNYPVALELFNAIITKYQQPGAEILPAWPRILAEKLIVIIGEKQNSNAASPKTPATTPAAAG